MYLVLVDLGRFCFHFEGKKKTTESPGSSAEHEILFKRIFFSFLEIPLKAKSLS